MRYLSNLLILLALIGCAETKTDLSGNTPLKINDFNAAFKNIELPIRINDTNIVAFTDTIKIGRKALEQFQSVEGASIEGGLSVRFYSSSKLLNKKAKDE